MTDTTTPQKSVHEDYYCEHLGYKRWGSFGYDRQGKTEWFCRDHRPDKDRR